MNILWLRRDLRLEDNTALFYCSLEDTKFLPIFIFDKKILNKISDKADARVSFIHSTVSDLKLQLQKYGGDLKVFYGEPLEVFKVIQAKYDVERVYSNEDYEPYAIKRDEKIKKYLSKNKVDFFQYKDQCIFSKNDILKNDGKPYTVYTPYKNKWLNTLGPKNIVTVSFKESKEKLFSTKPTQMIELSEMGFVESNLKFPKRIIRKNKIEEYKETRDFPAKDSTSHLSTHLRFGTVSVRKCAQVAYHSQDKTWLSELIWREFFMQILYHFPHVTERAFKEKYEKIKWINDKKHFSLWCEGKTGYPLVDAGMRELNSTGFMHNRVRMITASFLVKHLLIDWKWGEKYFARKLLDFDLSANNGNWQWVAGTGCDSAPYFRIFNPETQMKKFDKDLKYIKKWVPEFGTDEYTEPIIEHRYAYNRALMTYKKALS